MGLKLLTQCDICNRVITGPGVERSLKQQLKDLEGTMTYSVTRTLMPKDGPEPLTLCDECSDAFMYFMSNREALVNAVERMRLSNRIRFLFKMPLSTKQGSEANGI